jgi:catechol 2,3-dioxygenase-like lactoylglutathione lyase family enzyme
MFNRRQFLALSATAWLAQNMTWATELFPAALDHVIIGCSDLDGGIRFVEGHLGVRAAFGGVHPGLGTANALLSLGDRHYLEIMGPDPNAKDLAPEYAAEVAQLKALTSPRLVGWAVHRDDLDQFAQRLSVEGVATDGPTAGSRRRPDGKTLRWKTLALKSDPDNLLPFFIEWESSSIHPSQDAPAGCRIDSFAVAHPEPDAFRAQLKQLELTGLQVGPGAAPELRLRLASAKGTLTITS